MPQYRRMDLGFDMLEEDCLFPESLYAIQIWFESVWMGIRFCEMPQCMISQSSRQVELCCNEVFAGYIEGEI